MLRIGLVGEMGSGKSSCAAILYHKYDFQVVSFATPIKNLLIDLLRKADPAAEKNVNWSTYLETHKNHPAIRSGLQYIGDTLGREIIGSDTWLQHFTNRNRDLLSQENARIVVDDVRYPDELAYLRKRGFTIVHVDRDPRKREEYIRNQITQHCPELNPLDVERLLQEWQCHPSEAQIAGLDTDENVEYNEFSTWAEDHIGGSIR